MAATTGGAFKAYLEAQGLGVPVFRDGKPKGSSVSKYVVVQEAIAVSEDGSGDFGDMGPEAAAITVVEDVQIDLYDLAREVGPAGVVTRSIEDYALPGILERLLRGCGLAPYAPTRVYGHKPYMRQRWPISDNVVRHTWTVRIHRELL